MTAFDAVLFDYGGVFTTSPFAAVGDRGADLGVDPKLLIDTIFGPYDRDTDHPWHRLERGEISLEVAVGEIVTLGEEHGIDSNPLKFFAAMGAGGINESMVDCVRRLKAEGTKTALVTNNAAEFREGWRKSIPVEELFDVIVDSSEEGVRKPDVRIFERTLERLEVEARRAIFLDDYEGNVNAAEALGICGILVGPDPSVAVTEVDQLIPRRS